MKHRHRAQGPHWAFILLLLATPIGNANHHAIAGDNKENAITIKVLEVTPAPVVDGDLADWPPLDSPLWSHIQVQPALKNDPKNVTGTPDVLLAARVSGDRFFLGIRWPDPTADTDFKIWKWQNNQYKQGKQRDDMLAVRFYMDGQYDTCMLPEGNATYRVDVWLWSAGRSNAASLAEDMIHTISDQPIEDAAEYPINDQRTIYIKKRQDSGDRFYEMSRPDPNVYQGETLPGVILTGGGSGSLVDVSAVGHWKQGYWSLEMARKLVTGQDDDVALLPGHGIPGGIAVFNKGSAEHKSVEGHLLFDLSAIKR